MGQNTSPASAEHHLQDACMLIDSQACARDFGLLDAPALICKTKRGKSHPSWAISGVECHQEGCCRAASYTQLGSVNDRPSTMAFRVSVNFPKDPCSSHEISDQGIEKGSPCSQRKGRLRVACTPYRSVAKRTQWLNPTKDCMVRTSASSCSGSNSQRTGPRPPQHPDQGKDDGHRQQQHAQSHHQRSPLLQHDGGQQGTFHTKHQSQHCHLTRARGVKIDGMSILLHDANECTALQKKDPPEGRVFCARYWTRTSDLTGVIQWL